MSQDDRIPCVEFDRDRLEPRLSLEIPGNELMDEVSIERGGTEIRMLKR